MYFLYRRGSLAASKIHRALVQRKFNKNAGPQACEREPQFFCLGLYSELLVKLGPAVFTLPLPKNKKTVFQQQKRKKYINYQSVC